MTAHKAATCTQKETGREPKDDAMSPNYHRTSGVLQGALILNRMHRTCAKIELKSSMSEEELQRPPQLWQKTSMLDPLYSHHNILGNDASAGLRDEREAL